MNAQVILIGNPFDPLRSRHVIEVTEPVAIGAWIEANVVAAKFPFLRGTQDGWLHDDEWDSYEIKDGDRVALVAVPQGGGGGRKNPLATILTLALVVATSFAGGIGGALATAGGGVSGGLGLTATTPLLNAGALTGFGQLAAASINAVVVAGGSYLINLALPPNIPKAPEAPSPTYSITSRGNQARLGGTQEVQYGRVKSYPSLAAVPYREFSDDGIDEVTGEAIIGTQTLYELYLLGWGYYDDLVYQMVDQDLTSFGSQIEVTKYEPGEAVTAFPTNVITVGAVDDIEFKAFDQLTDGTYADDVDFEGTLTGAGEESDGVYYIDDSGADFGANDSLLGKTLHFKSTVISKRRAMPYWVTITGNTATRIRWAAPDGSYLEGALPSATPVGGDLDTTEYRVLTHNNWMGGEEGYAINLSTELSEIDAIGVDIVMPEGHWLQWTEGPGEVGVGWRFEGRKYDDEGDPAGPWQPLFYYDGRWPTYDAVLIPPASHDVDGAWPGRLTEAYNSNCYVYGNTQKPIRFSLKTGNRSLASRARISFPPLDPGRYRVRARLCTTSNIENFESDSKVHTRSLWVGLRGYSTTQNQSWPGRTMIAVKSKADANVNSSNMQQFAVTATRMLEDYVGTVESFPDLAGTLGSAPFSTAASTATVSVVAPAGLVATLIDGAIVTWTGATAVGGIPAALLNRGYPVRLTGDTSLEFDVSETLGTDPVRIRFNSSTVRLTVAADLAADLTVGMDVVVDSASDTAGLSSGLVNGTREITAKGSTYIEFSLPSYALPSAPLRTVKGISRVAFLLPEDLADNVEEGDYVRATISGATAVGGLTTGQINITTNVFRATAEVMDDQFGIEVEAGDVWGYFDVAVSATSTATGGGGSVSVQLVGIRNGRGGGRKVSVSVPATSTATGGGASITYETDEWTALQPSRRISSAIIDAATDTDYGAKLPLTRLDLDRLKTLELTWDARDRYEDDGVTWKAEPVKDRFDFRFDNRMPFYDAVNLIARCGRAHVVWPAGILTVIRDEPRALATAMYTPRNMLPKSLELNYMFPTGDTPDHLVVEFFNEDFWDWDEVIVSPLDREDPDYPGEVAGRIRFPGITNRKHAWREGAYEFGSTKYRRRTINFSTDVEGHVPQYGDLIEVAHDLPSWGQWGHLIDYEVGEATATLTLSEPVDWGDGEITSTSHVIQLKDEYGRPSAAGLAYCQPGPRADQVVIDGAFVEEDIGIHVVDRYLREATSYSFGLVDRNRLQALVTGLRPHGSSIVDVECYSYRVAGVYDADEDLAYTPPTAVELLARETAGPAIARVDALLYAGQGADRATVRVGWSAAPWARYYVVETSVDGGRTWKRVGRTEATSFEFPVTERPYREVVLDAGFTAGASELMPTGFLLYRDEVGGPDAWTNGQYDGKILVWRSGAHTGERVTIRRTVYGPIFGVVAYYLDLADPVTPKPVADVDTYDIAELRPVVMQVAVRAVNRLEGPRTTDEVDLSPVATAGTTITQDGAGQVEGARSLGVDGAGEESNPDRSTRVSLWRFDADGNLFVRGRVYSQATAPDAYAIYVGDLLLPEGDTVDTYELPAAPRGGDALLFFDGGLLLRRVESAPSAGEYSVTGSTVTTGAALSSEARIVMVADSETGDLAGLHVGELCDFIPDTAAATLPFTPYDDTEVALWLNGYPLTRVDATPGADEFTIDGADIETGATLVDGDELVCLGVDSLGSEAARRLRVVQWETDTLPVTPLFPDEVAILEGGETRWFARVPVTGQFSLSGSPALSLVWPSPAPASTAVKVAIALTAAAPSAPPVSYLTALGSLTQAFTDETTVTVTHNFGAFPVVNVVDDAGEVIVPEAITHTSVDAFTVTLLSSTTGTVVASLGGGVTDAVTITEKSADYTLGAAEYFLNYTGTGGTLTLPAAAALTTRPRIVKNSGTGTLVVTPDGTDTIDGAATFKLLPKRSISIFPNADEWLVV